MLVYPEKMFIAYIDKNRLRLDVVTRQLATTGVSIKGYLAAKDFLLTTLQQQIEPRLILIPEDLNDMNARALIQFAKNHPLTQKAKIVMVATRWLNVDKKTFTKAGITEFLETKNDLHQFIESVRSLIETEVTQAMQPD